MSHTTGLKRPRADPSFISEQPSKRPKPDATSSPLNNDATATGNRWVGPWGLLSGGIETFKRALNFGQPASNAPAPVTTASHLPTPGPSRPHTPATRKTPLIPSTFSPAAPSPSFRSLTNSEVKAKYKAEYQDWRWTAIRSGKGMSERPKPPRLLALENELRARKTKQEQEKSLSKGMGLMNGSASLTRGAVGGSGFQRKAPMGREKKRQISTVAVPRIELDDLPTPSLFRSSRSQPPSPPPPPPPLPRSPSPRVPAPSMHPKSPWAPAYDPAIYSPPSTSTSTSTAPLSPRLRPRDLAAPTPASHNGATFASSASSLTSSRPDRPSRKQHKSHLVQRDLATLAQLQDGAVVSPISSPTLAPTSSSSATLGGSSPSSSSAKYVDLDADEDELYMGGLISTASLNGAWGKCVSSEEAQRRADMDLYMRKVEEGAREQEGGLAANNVKISHHRRRRPPTTASLIQPSSFFPEPSPFVRPKPSKIPAPTTTRKKSGGVDYALQAAKKTLAEPLGRGQSFEKYEEMRRAVEEVEEEEEEEEVRQKRRVWPKQLAPEHLAIVKAAWRNPRFHSSITAADVEARNLARLKDGDWLDDEVINFIGKLINMRSDAADKSGDRGEAERTLRKAFCFPTMFYNKLLEVKGDVDKGFNNVKRWTKKFDTFEKDIIIVPINQGGNHWVCAAVNLKKKRFEYYDSLGRARASVYTALRRWLELEHKTRKEAGKIKSPEWQELDLTHWENYWYEDRPKQNNTCDCGVFTCWFMESLSREYQGFDFAQENMHYLRRKLVLNIDQKELLETEEWE